MTITDYNAVLGDTIVKLGDAMLQIERLETEAAKLRQFFAATLNMLPDDDRGQWMQLFSELAKDVDAKEASLKDAVLKTLRQAHPRYLTAAGVRDALVNTGFNFGSYTSNPLASVSTALRRLKADEAETSDAEGVASYRVKPKRYPRLKKGLVQAATEQKLREMGVLSDMK